mmetsp:Transcript_949/g.1702  ORF Transcript_949/g.1702 Transcript_949/m.1702 type:complete len:386 (-) Transcript_949:355-1512(-)
MFVAAFHQGEVTRFCTCLTAGPLLNLRERPSSRSSFHGLSFSSRPNSSCFQSQSGRKAAFLVLSTLTAPERPKRAEDGLVKLVTGFKPLLNLLKVLARRAFIKRAAEHGIQWEEIMKRFQGTELERNFQDVFDKDVKYPEWYLVPFHAYDEGNLCWDAAREVEPATFVIPFNLKENKGRPIPFMEAQDNLRGPFLQALDRDGPPKGQVKNVLDAACSIGVSTSYINDFYRQREGAGNVRTVGLDLSPYFLSVAKLRTASSPGADNVQWVHGDAANTTFGSGTFDVASLQFLFHEVPHGPTIEIFREMYRILRPGGAVAILEIDPDSTAVQSMPSVARSLMGLTEPWISDYYSLDMKKALEAAGFEYVSKSTVSSRHIAIIARKPQ